MGETFGFVVVFESLGSLGNNVNPFTKAEPNGRKQETQVQMSGREDQNLRHCPLVH